jgi:hypothetical protein
MKIRVEIIRTIIWSTLFAAFVVPVSHAQTPNDAAYLCTSEMAVGFEYNKSLKGTSKNSRLSQFVRV